MLTTAPAVVGAVARRPTRIIGILRLASGLFFLVRPTKVSNQWVAEASDEMSVLTRSVGARDLVIGAGLLATGRPEWLAASIAADLADGLDAAVGSVPSHRRGRVAAWAFGFATLGSLAAYVGRPMS